MPRRHFLCFKFSRFKPVPIILDLVEDRVRNRYYSAMLVMTVVGLVFCIALSDKLMAPAEYDDNTGQYLDPEILGVSYSVSQRDLQYALLLVSVLLIPVFMANSLWHRGWWMIVAVPLIGILVFLVIGLLQTSLEYQSAGLMGLVKFTVMADSIFMASVIALAIFFVALCIEFCKNRKRTNRMNYADKKAAKSIKYTKARLPLGTRNFESNKKQAVIDIANAEAAAITLYKEQLHEHENAAQPVGFVNKIKNTGRMMKDLGRLLYETIVGEFTHITSEVKAYLIDALTFSDEFYYPQRILVAAFVSFLVAFLMMSFTLYLNEEVHFWISRVAYWVKQALAVATNADAAVEGTGFTTDAKDRLQTIYDDMITWRAVLYSSGIVSSVLALVVSLISLLAFMNTYRKHIRLLRQGKYFFDRSKVTVLESPNFVGIKTVHCAFGFVILWIVIQTIVTLFFSPFTSSFANFLVDNIWLLILLPTATYLFVNVVIRYYCLNLDGRTIHHRRYWSVFEFFWVFYFVVSAFSVALLRFAFSLISLIIRYISTNNRLYTSVIKDAGYNAYISSLIMDHQHNNPILCCFCDLIRQNMIKNRLARKESFAVRNPERFRIVMKTEHSKHRIIDETEMKLKIDAAHRERIINRWWLLITLFHNPSLLKDRRYPYRPSDSKAPNASPNFVLGAQKVLE